MIALLYVNVAAHESAHAVACFLAGAQVTEVRLGAGPALRLGTLSVGILPLGGGVSFRYGHLSALGRDLIFLSGPLVTAALLAYHALADGSALQRVVIVQLIAQLAVSLLPGKDSDLSKAREMRGDTRERVPSEEGTRGEEP